MSELAPPPGRPIITAAGAAIVVAMIGLVMTDLGPWYANLKMPAWKPPDALFGPAWTLIFAAAALAGAYGWRALPQPAARFALCGYFAINALLNILWSALFFRLHRPDWALLEVGLLWLSIVLLMFTLWRGSRLATWLLLPYLLWVSYAAVLNLAVVRLNPT
jgi:tryptophan-rich sensory protein